MRELDFNSPSFVFGFEVRASTHSKGLGFAFENCDVRKVLGSLPAPPAHDNNRGNSSI